MEPTRAWTYSDQENSALDKLAQQVLKRNLTSFVMPPLKYSGEGFSEI